MRRVLLSLVLFVSSLVWSSAQEIEYYSGNWESLLEYAKKKKQPVFVDFYTSWCGYCKKMDRTTFRDTSVTEFVKKNFIAYKIDAEKGEGVMLARNNGVRGYPTIVYFDHKGNRMAVDPGYKTAEGFLQKLKYYKEQSRTKIVSDMSEGFIDYLKVKRKYIDELEGIVDKNSMRKINALEDKAFEYGKEGNDFEFKELKYDARNMSADVPIRLEVKYYQGRGDLKKYNESLLKLISLGDEVTNDEKHYYLLLLLENEAVTLELLKVANTLALDRETYQVLDTKAAVQMMYGDTEDAKDTSNKALKLGKKKKEDTESTKILQDIIDDNK